MKIPGQIRPFQITEEANDTNNSNPLTKRFIN